MNLRQTNRLEDGHARDKHFIAQHSPEQIPIDLSRALSLSPLSTTTIREDRKERLHDQVSELLQERLEAGYEGLSAREVLLTLPADLKSVRNVYRHIGEVVAAND